MVWILRKRRGAGVSTGTGVRPGKTYSREMLKRFGKEGGMFVLKKNEEKNGLKSARSIVITSGKGGVGKSTVTGNLAAALAGRGRNVVVVDMDIGLRNMDIILGLESRVVFNMLDVTDGICRLEQALVKSKQWPNLKLLPASQTRNKDSLRASDGYLVMDMLKPDFDYILIDCPAGIEAGFQRSMEFSDEAVLVVNPEVSSLRDSDRVLSILESVGRKESTSLVINRYNERLAAEGAHVSANDIVDIMKINVLGIVPDTHLATMCSNRGLLMPESTVPGKVFAEMAARIEGEKVPMRISFEEKKPFFKRLGEFFAKKEEYSAVDREARRREFSLKVKGV